MPRTLIAHAVALLQRVVTRPTPTRPIACRTRLGVHSLEGRDVPAGNPTAVADTLASIHQGAPLTARGSVLTNDDPDGVTTPLKGYLSSPVTTTNGGIVGFNGYGSNVAYKPRAGRIGDGGVIANGFTGIDSFKYVLKQGEYTSPAATVTIEVLNDAPTVATTDVTFSTGKNQSFHVNRATLTAAAGASDINDEDTIGVATADGTRTNVVVPTAAGGKAYLNWQTGFSYNPPSATFTGWDSFRVSFWDKAGFSEVVTVHVYVGSGAAPELPSVTVAKVADAAEAGLVGGRFAFTRTGSLDDNLVVNYAIDPSSTASAADYTLTPEQAVVPYAPTVLVIPAGQATAYLRVTPKADNLVESPNDVLAVSVTTGTGYKPGGGYASVVIVDDPPRVEVASAIDRLTEGSSGDIVLRRAGGDVAAPLDVTVGFGSIIDVNPAVWGTDFTVSAGGSLLSAGGGVVTFGPGQGTLVLNVAATPDPSPTETYGVRVQLPDAVLPNGRPAYLVMAQKKADVKVVKVNVKNGDAKFVLADPKQDTLDNKGKITVNGKAVEVKAFLQGKLDAVNAEAQSYQIEGGSLISFTAESADAATVADLHWMQFIKRTFTMKAGKPPVTTYTTLKTLPILGEVTYYSKPDVWFVDSGAKTDAFYEDATSTVRGKQETNSVLAMADKPQVVSLADVATQTAEFKTYLVYKKDVQFSISWQVEWTQAATGWSMSQADIKSVAVGEKDLPVDKTAQNWLWKYLDKDFTDKSEVPNPLR